MPKGNTPEGKIKEQVKEVFRKYGKDIWSDWPVPAGYGKSTLDCIGCVRGRFFAVETKAPGKRMTDLQGMTAALMLMAGGEVFLVCDEGTLLQLDMWLDAMVHNNGHYKRETPGGWRDGYTFYEDSFPASKNRQAERRRSDPPTPCGARDHRPEGPGSGSAGTDPEPVPLASTKARAPISSSKTDGSAPEFAPEGLLPE